MTNEIILLDENTPSNYLKIGLHQDRVSIVIETVINHQSAAWLRFEYGAIDGLMKNIQTAKDNLKKLMEEDIVQKLMSPSGSKLN